MASLLYQLHVSIALLKSKPDNQKYHSMIMSQDIKCEQINSTMSALNPSYRLTVRTQWKLKGSFIHSPDEAKFINISIWN